MEWFQESPLGQLVRLVTRNKVLLYQEEKPDFVLPWEKALEEEKQAAAEFDKETQQVPTGEQRTDTDGNSQHESVETPVDEVDLEKQETVPLPGLSQHTTQATGGHASSNLSRHTTITRTKTREQTVPWSVDRMATEEREAIERKESRIIVPQKTAEGIILVDWYSTDDPENPQNWSLSKKSWVTWVLWAYTFVVYCASAIYTPSEQGVMVAFNVGIPKAALGLSIYVLGYGFGPMLFSPLSEIPSIGRNLPYITTFTLFLLLSIPAALTPTYAGLLVTRFLTGFFGSPCLATGGATIQDLYSFTHLPYGFSAWVAANFCAPALGPLLSGFSVPALGWRWSLYEVMLMTAPALIMMWVAFPETSAANILLRRARRLRKLTGNENYKSQSEIDQANLTTKQVAIDALVKPTQIMFEDPAVFFTNIYSAFIYGVYYSFFEAFPLVYIEIYGFNVGEMGIGKLRYSPLRCSSTC
jgi:DHA1 family multidrug resistance protein-like MFS transporter